MWSRLFAHSRPTAAWFINLDRRAAAVPLTLGTGNMIAPAQINERAPRL
jgi:hypothetical protein